jgi:cell division protein FtsL
VLAPKSGLPAVFPLSTAKWKIQARQLLVRLEQFSSEMQTLHFVKKLQFLQQSGQNQSRIQEGIEDSAMRELEPMEKRSFVIAITLPVSTPFAASNHGL